MSKVEYANAKKAFEKATEIFNIEMEKRAGDLMRAYEKKQEKFERAKMEYYTSSGLSKKLEDIKKAAEQSMNDFQTGKISDLSELKKMISDAKKSLEEAGESTEEMDMIGGMVDMAEFQNKQ